MRVNANRGGPGGSAEPTRSVAKQIPFLLSWSPALLDDHFPSW
jgi:hypothetical protein